MSAPFAASDVTRFTVWFKYSLAGILIGLLSACGFALRGPVDFSFSTIYVGLPDSSPLAGDLKRNLRANGKTTIASDAQHADVILDVLGETREKVILSLNNQGRVREYNLLYSFRFRVRDKDGKEILEPVTIQLKRNLTFNEAQALAKESEEALLYRDMQSDLVQQVLRRLARLKVE
jgi:LPS-assembly lipoprotein